MESFLTEKLAPITAKLDSGALAVQAPAQQMLTPPSSSVSSLRTWKHPDGSFKSVPVEFVLPGEGNPVKLCYPLWLKGNPALGIRPHRDLTTADFGIFKQTPKGRRLVGTNQSRRHSERKSVFNFLISHLSGPEQHELDENPTDELIEKTWDKVKHLLYDNVAYAENTTAGEKYRKKVGSQCVSTANDYIKRKRGNSDAPGEHLVKRRAKRATKAAQLDEIVDSDMDE